LEQIMSTVVDTASQLSLPTWTVADLAARFGHMPDHRIRRLPPLGTATEADVIQWNEHNPSLCELVDGILVEKTVGLYESNLAYLLQQFLAAFLAKHNLGTVFGPDGMMRLRPGCIRVPDVSFVSWERLGKSLERQEAALDGGPDLAIEIISPSNTREEMQEKLSDYFEASVRQVWYVYPKPREVHVFDGPTAGSIVRSGDTLEGGSLLPGFTLPIDQLFQAQSPHS
jgi:Uma2 family endonuclease